ncbi:DUF4185 domain-containing protein [Prevotella sp. KH2C16]|uniref:DUF4185 domain-containing protein n=1 Tax=Prevotella sp. KH2C16 TaxID=1855325 RepID=UPI0008EAB43D|nr:DUF4185 domain-containing protein [Prevotella sp. KH2C16]SFG69993.1 protein of unknown function [Prevotella sp. KH2C16]
MIKKNNTLFFLSFFLLSCGNGNSLISNSKDDLVEVDTAIINKIMPANGDGVTGADGSISIELGDGRSLFMWGDSFLGNITDGTRRAPSTRFIMGNTFSIIDNQFNVLKTLYNGDSSSPAPYLKPTGKTEPPTWYWPGDGFVKDGILHLFMSQFYKSGNSPLSFQYVGCDYFRIRISDFSIMDKTHFEAPDVNNVHYGHAILVKEKYVYIYGTKTFSNGSSEVHVCRARIINDKLSDYSYWNGSQWQQEASMSHRISGILKSVPEQFNVVELDGIICLIFQNRLANIKNIYSYTSKSPAGPFTNEKLLYTVNEVDFDRDQMMTYNAMVHPQFQKNHKVLMCYNVNTYDSSKTLFDKASVYRPRFFWVPINNIIRK